MWAAYGRGAGRSGESFLPPSGGQPARWGGRRVAYRPGRSARGVVSRGLAQLLPRETAA